MSLRNCRRWFSSSSSCAACMSVVGLFDLEISPTLKSLSDSAGATGYIERNGAGREQVVWSCLHRKERAEHRNGGLDLTCAMQIIRELILNVRFVMREGGRRERRRGGGTPECAVYWSGRAHHAARDALRR